MNNNQGRFNSLLQKQSSALEDLYAVLMKEFIALKERNSESITLLTEEKNTLLNNLEEFEKQRQLCLQEYNQVNTNTVTNEINQLRSDIEVCLNKCKKQNNINGGIIEMSKLFNEKMLDILCGHTDKEATYSAAGKNNTNKNQHSLGRV